MRLVIQRVSCASVTVEGRLISSIDKGLLTFWGVERGDKFSDLDHMVNKIINLRIFEDKLGKMNLSLLDIGGEHLIVSQFTLLGDCTKGRRPHFLNAEDPQLAKSFYERAIELSSKYVKTSGGVFAANMEVSLINEGPATFVL